MDIAIIGLGSIGQRHAATATRLQQEGRISSIRAYDINPERRQQTVAKYPAVDAREDLAATVADADAIFICTPTSKHISVMEEISRTRKYHFFIEKPLAHSLDGCDDFLFAQQRAGKVTAVGYLLRFHPVVRAFRRLVTEGTVGRALSVRVESGFFLPQWHPWEDYRDFYMSWKTGGGGALLDTSHEINYMHWIFGPIVEVKGYFDHVSDLEISSDDLAIAVCRFAGGFYGQIQLDLLQFDECRTCKVIGTEGVAIADLMKNTVTWQRRGDKAWTSESFAVDYDQIYYDEVREFLDVCGQGGTLTSPAADARVTLDVIEGIRRSHALGVAVRLPLY
jgi:predicted dehydrogenase